MKFIKPNILLSYNQLVNLIDLEKPIVDYIVEKYPNIKFNNRKLLPETTINQLLKISKKDKILSDLLDKYLKYIESVEIEQKLDKYNI